MNIVLLIRRDKEYWLHNKMSFNGVVLQKFEKAIKKRSFMWNLFFRMKYLEFRKRLAKIASLSYSQNNFDDMIMYMDRDHIDSLEPGTLIVPMDDDDWFSPDLVKILRKIKKPHEQIYWDQYTKRTNGVIEQKDRCGDVKIDSCCYALKAPCNYLDLWGHWRLRRKNMYHIPHALALKVETWSCQSVNCSRPIESITISGFKRHLVEETTKDLNSSDVFPEEYSNQVRLYKELLKELLESQISDMV